MNWKIRGNKNLEGVIPVSGSKNAVLPIMCATLLSTEPVVLHNVPNLSDVHNLMKIMNEFGVKTDFDTEKGVLSVDASGLKNVKVDSLTSSKLRASFLVAGALLGKFQDITFPFPGGCSIGERPIDLHLKAFQMLGAKSKIEKGQVRLTSPNGLSSNLIFLDFPSVGATENALLTAVSLQGKTTILNAAEEPEVEDLVNFLKTIGADIRKEDVKSWSVYGGKILKGGEYRVMYDRIEAGTWLTLSALTNGKVKVSNLDPSSISSFRMKFEDSGFGLRTNSNFEFYLLQDELKSITFQTGPHPSYPTDMQPLMLTLATLTEGMHIGVETIFNNRFQYLQELMKMGGNSKVFEGKMAVVNGVTNLSGATVKATDLRAGAALVIAGLLAEGETTITDTHHIERGYENIFAKLRKIGAIIETAN